MLLRSLFAIALFATLAETIVHGAHALAQQTLRRTAASAVQREFEAATSAARVAISAAIEAGGDPRDLTPVAPAPLATCVLASASGCALESSATVTFSSSPLPSASPCPSDGCTIYVQGNDEIEEGRVRASIAVRASATNGDVLAARDGQLAFRTLRVAPYAALAGTLDDSLQRLSGAGAGDDGGEVPQGTSPGSLIDVVYENRTTKKTMPANVWRSQVQRPGAAPEAWSP